MGKRSGYNILDLSPSEAKDFFLKGESYFTLDLPCYFQFNQILADVDTVIMDNNLSNFYHSEEENTRVNFRDQQMINHKITLNKNGPYEWRPLQLIHPAIYVSLVQKITKDKNWEEILSRFNLFSQNQKIQCMSLPAISTTRESDKATQVLNWWNKVELISISLALDYEYLVLTDITDCYPSIYTHSISWALHTITKAKRNTNDKKLIGNQIDRCLQNMNRGQTNGIPQGSTLMDFIAEIVLGYADLLLTQKIAEQIIDYHIIRYRDDYKIFTNNPHDGEKIITFLAEILDGLGLKLKTQKTGTTKQLISGSIKSDKLFWIRQTDSKKTILKQLLVIHHLSSEFPNSGSLLKALNFFYSNTIESKIPHQYILPSLSIIIDIVCQNSRTYPICLALMSKFISCLNDNSQKEKLLERFQKRLEKLPHTYHLMIWLQRITLTFKKDYPYHDTLCQLVAGDQVRIWNSEWLQPCFKNLIDHSNIINIEIINKLPDVIQLGEVELFKSGDY